MIDLEIDSQNEDLLDDDEDILKYKFQNLRFNKTSKSLNIRVNFIIKPQINALYQKLLFTIQIMAIKHHNVNFNLIDKIFTYF